MILPLIPVHRIYPRNPTEVPPQGIPHYKDYSTSGSNFPTFRPEDGSAATTPVYANDDIQVTSNSRFIYIFSTTGEFEPITIWADLTYGATDLIAPYDQPTNMSGRSAGWHWEKFGSVLPKPGTMTTTVSPTAGLSLAGNYEFAYRYRDTYRNRWSPLSDRKSVTMSSASTIQMNSIRYTSADDPRYAEWNVELALHYWGYDLWGTFVDTVGGNLQLGDAMYSVNKTVNTTLPFTLAEHMRVGTSTAVPFVTRVFSTTRDDTTSFTGSTTNPDLSTLNDNTLAVTRSYDSLTDEPGTIPLRVKSAISYQGLTVVAEELVESEDSTANSSEENITTSVSSPFVNLRWSSLSTVAPEMFPVSNTYLTRISVNSSVALVQAGDFALLLGDGQILRLRRTYSAAGPGVAIDEIISGMDLVAPLAVCDVKGSVFGVFRDGAYVIEPNTGSPRKVPLLTRVIQDMWSSTLSSVRAEYDSSLNAVFLLNPSTKNAVILWLDTQLVTTLERIPYQEMVTQRFGGHRRLVLVTGSGRFVVPRMYLSEIPSAYRTLHGGHATFNNWPANTRKFAFPVASVVFNPLTQLTTLKFSGHGFSHNFFRRDFNDNSISVPSTIDYYWKGLNLYNLTTKSTVPLEVLGTTPGLTGNNQEVIIRGDVTSQVAVGDYLAGDPVPFGVLLGALDDGDRLSGTVKRHANSINVVMPFMSGSVPSGVSWFTMGVLDYSDLRGNEPHSSGSLFFPPPPFESRITSCPSPSVTVSVDRPHDLFGYMPATGHLLFPFVRSFVTDPYFELKELVVRGRISGSEVTVA
jgi:hypothetical protein